MIVIKKNPTKDRYRALLDLAFAHSDCFQLVLRKDMGVSINYYDDLLRDLDIFLIEKKELSEWASQKLGDNNTAFVFFYKSRIEAKDILLNISDSLFEWVHPKLPEDLSFINNGSVWLSTCSHENYSVIISDDEQNTLEYLREARLDVELI
jgi:hypothetical protein